MTPIPTEWWLRPDSNAARVGAHNAVVWKRLYFKPFPASRSAVGVAHGPPNALDAAKPTSSSRTTSTLGAPSGGRRGSIAGNDASGSLASNGRVPSNGVSGIGRTVRGLLGGGMAVTLTQRIARSSPGWDEGRWRTGSQLFVCRRGSTRRAVAAMIASSEFIVLAASARDVRQAGNRYGHPVPGREDIGRDRLDAFLSVAHDPQNEKTPEDS